MIPDTLAKVAKGLGGEYFSDSDAIYKRIARAGILGPQPAVQLQSDGDLLLAILNRAAELGRMPILTEDPSWTPAMPGHQWWCELVNDLGASPVTYFKGNGMSPFEAAALAFSQLPECQS